MPRWRDEWSKLPWYQAAAVWIAAFLSAVATVWRWSLRPRRFRDVVARYGKPLIIGVLYLLVLAAYPGASLEGFKAGLAGAAIWEVGKRIILS